MIKKSMNQKKTRHMRKYHSDWGDDYEEFGNRRNTKEEKDIS